MVPCKEIRDSHAVDSGFQSKNLLDSGFRILLHVAKPPRKRLLLNQATARLHPKCFPLQGLRFAKTEEIYNYLARTIAARGICFRCCCSLKIFVLICVILRHYFFFYSCEYLYQIISYEKHKREKQFR